MVVRGGGCFILTQIFFSQIQIIIVIYTGFVLDHNRRSALIPIFNFFTFTERQNIGVGI